MSNEKNGKDVRSETRKSATGVASSKPTRPPDRVVLLKPVPAATQGSAAGSDALPSGKQSTAQQDS